MTIRYPDTAFQPDTVGPIPAPEKSAENEAGAIADAEALTLRFDREAMAEIRRRTWRRRPNVRTTTFRHRRGAGVLQ